MAEQTTNQVEYFKPFLISYRYEGATWNIEIKAKSHNDAERRLHALRTGSVDGELVMTIPAHSGWLAPFFCWLRNAFGRLE